MMRDFDRRDDRDDFDLSGVWSLQGGALFALGVILALVVCAAWALFG